MPRRVRANENGAAMAQVRSPPKKSDRSREENQERAYIAASRRSDRSLEARMQSAAAASQIHKKRTGKGFKITEEIVLKEEMYEEDDDDTPRAFRHLAAAHLLTASPELNGKVNAFITQRVALATWNRQREVNRMFAESFPHATHHSSHLHQSVYFQSLQPTPHSAPPGAQPPPPPARDAMPARESMRSHFRDRSDGGPMDRPRERSKSPPSQRQASPLPGCSFAAAATAASSSSRPSSRHPSVSHRSSTSGSAIDTGSATSPQTIGTPVTPIDPYATLPHIMPQSTSSFTSQLPLDIWNLASLDMADPLAGVLMGGQPTVGDNFKWPTHSSSVVPGSEHQAPVQSPYSPCFPQHMQNLAMPTETQSPPMPAVADLFGETTCAQFYSTAQEQTRFGDAGVFPSPGFYMPTEAGVDLKTETGDGLKTEPGVEADEGIDPLDDTWKDMINYPDDAGNEAWVIEDDLLSDSR